MRRLEHGWSDKGRSVSVGTIHAQWLTTSFLPLSCLPRPPQSLKSEPAVPPSLPLSHTGFHLIKLPSLDTTWF